MKAFNLFPFVFFVLFVVKRNLPLPHSDHEIHETYEIKAFNLLPFLFFETFVVKKIFLRTICASAVNGLFSHALPYKAVISAIFSARAGVS